jgi:tripartite-type tricarboxylate transporter receptor subunit TctC
MDRRLFTQAGIGAAVTAVFGAGSSAFAQGLPELSKIIVGFPAGGPTDAFARKMAEKLRGVTAVNVVVDNKPGAGGQVGVLTVKDAAPDGLTMLFTPASMLTVYQHSFSKLGYKSEDVVGVSTGMYVAHGFGVGPAVPESVKSVKEFIEWAKANPDKGSVGNPGQGSMPHLLAGNLAKITGAPLNNIPFAGSAPGIQQLLGGQIAAMCSPMGDYLPHMKTGKLRLLATSGPTRSPFTPDTPTFKEQGYNDLVVKEWFAFFMPAKTPAAIVEKTSAAIRTALSNPEFAASVAQFAFEVSPATPAQLAALWKTDAETAGRLVRAIGFKADS